MLSYLSNFRSVLINFLLFSLLSLLIFLPCLSIASCYLPEPGEYKFLSSFAFIDNDSVEIKEQREEIYLNSQKMIVELEQQKIDIQNLIINTKKREITNTQQRDLQEIDLAIKELNVISSEQKSYSDDKMSNMLVEYGINDKYSFGMKFIYKINKFLPDAPRSKNIIARDTDVFVKYKIASNENWIITLQPKLSVNNYGNLGNRFSQELGLILGHSKQIKKGVVNFYETGVFVGRCISKKCNYNKSSDVTFTQGVKLKNGLIFYNFVQYSARDVHNSVYQRSMYEQISIAKEISFAKLELKNFAISAGYFFSQSLVNQKIKISGPIFSVWFSI
jgi:hypothetical protein